LADALSNPKVAKSADALGTLTAPLHLAPSDESGIINVCVFAGACRALCLNGAGNPAYENGKHKARTSRVALYAGARGAFLQLLVAEIAAHVIASRRAAMDCAVRLNATSDILYERLAITIDYGMARYLSERTGDTFRPGTYANVMTLFPEVTFYDYTKIPPKARASRLPQNYKLTYSYDPQNPDARIVDAINAGWNVAVPFQVKKGAALPQSVTLAGLTLPVIDGDVHDFRPADPQRCVVGLRFKRVTGAKGRALGARAANGEGFALPVPALVRAAA